MLLQLLRSDGYITVNKKLAQSIGLDAAILYGELISKHFWYESRDMLTEDGYFYCTIDQLEGDTTLSRYQQGRAISTLASVELIFVTVRGMPARRYFSINQDEEPLRRVLEPDSQFVKNSQSSLRKTDKQVCEKPHHSLQKTSKQVCRKPTTNNTNNKPKNKTKNIPVYRQKDEDKFKLLHWGEFPNGG